MKLRMPMTTTKTHFKIEIPQFTIFFKFNIYSFVHIHLVGKSSEIENKFIRKYI